MYQLFSIWAVTIHFIRDTLLIRVPPSSPIIIFDHYHHHRYVLYFVCLYLRLRQSIRYPHRLNRRRNDVWRSSSSLHLVAFIAVTSRNAAPIDPEERFRPPPPTTSSTHTTLYDLRFAHCGPDRPISYPPIRLLDEVSASVISRMDDFRRYLATFDLPHLRP